MLHKCCTEPLGTLGQQQDVHDCGTLGNNKKCMTVARWANNKKCMTVCTRYFVVVLLGHLLVCQHLLECQRALWVWPGSVLAALVWLFFITQGVATCKATNLNMLLKDILEFIVESCVTYIKPARWTGVAHATIILDMPW